LVEAVPVDRLLPGAKKKGHSHLLDLVETQNKVGDRSHGVSLPDARLFRSAV
jgi:hypothetical protein